MNHGIIRTWLLWITNAQTEFCGFSCDCDNSSVKTTYHVLADCAIYWAHFSNTILKINSVATFITLLDVYDTSEKTFAIWFFSLPGIDINFGGCNLNPTMECNLYRFQMQRRKREACHCLTNNNHFVDHNVTHSGNNTNWDYHFSCNSDSFPNINHLRDTFHRVLRS